jgi:type II secretory pathway pseudopilin PulG
MKKIKISKKGLLIIGIAIFAVVLGILVRTYSQQVREREELSSDLSAQQTLAATLTADREDWEDKLAQAESLLYTSQAKFPALVDSIEYGDDLFEIADDCNLELAALQSSKPTAKQAGAVTYWVAPFVVKVAGDLDNILDFLYAIRTGDDFTLPWGAEVKGVQITTAIQAEATITLDIYSYGR